MNPKYHIPVLLHESVTALNIKQGGVYADATFGGGGHSKAILDTGKSLTLIATDKDPEAEENAKALYRQTSNDSNTFIFYRTDYKYLKNFINYAGFETIDGIIADTGVSSHQFDDAKRGFSFMKNADLDMRMNQDSEKTAAAVINEYSEEALFQILKKYGELKKAKHIAALIIQARQNKPIRTTSDFNEAIQKALPKYNEFKILAQVYQAIRIEVNNELKGLEKLLQSAESLIKTGGRLVVLSYHSLEDRLVKNFIKSGNTNGIVEKDVYGNHRAAFRMLKPKFITPSEDEIKRNSRASSAKLRVAEKI